MGETKNWRKNIGKLGTCGIVILYKLKKYWWCQEFCLTYKRAI